MLFQRNTHIDGKYREELAALGNDADTQCEGVFHYLDSNAGTAFDELVSIIQKDETNFPNRKPGQHEVALWLVRALEFDLVKLVSEQ